MWADTWVRPYGENWFVVELERYKFRWSWGQTHVSALGRIGGHVVPPTVRREILVILFTGEVAMAFYPLEKLALLYDGYQKVFKVAGHDLLLVQQDGVPYLIENRCPHMDAPLTHAAQVPGGLIRCRAHGIEFDLKSGKACGPLANTLDGLKKYPLIYEGNQLGVDL